MDENGTNLNAVVELLCDPDYQKVHFVQHMLPVNAMNRLYNMADVTALISSNEGWGLSLTESMMAGKMIIGNVTGGMSDQMRFEDENGDWVEYSKNFPSNHYGKYKKCGKWAMPVFPSNLSIVGSIPTPYIFDDRCDFREVAKAIEDVYNLTPEERQERGLEGRKWVTSDESMMSAKNMCKNVVSSIDRTFDTWKPKPKFEVIKIEKLPRKKLPHPLVY
jgi:glycosyltransferase involved in cell wall biosynthesis